LRKIGDGNGEVLEHGVDYLACLMPSRLSGLGHVRTAGATPSLYFLAHLTRTIRHKICLQALSF
jgi:hypothetical protein